jgi:PKD repeat protein
MKAFSTLAAGAAALALVGCTVHSTEAPALSGPSGLARALTITAIPDRISQDGASQSSVEVVAIGPDGKPQGGVAVRVDMLSGGVLADFGTLSARTIVTGADGKAHVVYTAPPPPPPTSQTVNTVSIRAVAIGTDALSANPETVNIQLMPLGVILPPASTPTAQFTFSPTPVNFNIPVIFDASTSCGGAISAGVCSSGSAIASYAWTFGDGGTASGKVVSHTYVSSTQPTTSFTVTLTVTNDRGLAASATQQVVVSASPPATGDFVVSPSAPLVGQVVLFNAEAVRPPAGHTLVSYNWNFGDGATGSGVVVSHAYGATGAYTVTLTVIDDVGQRTTLPPTGHTVTVGSTTGIPKANFSFTPASPVAAGTTVTFDASSSTAPNGATIVSYSWNFGDSSALVNGSSSTATHTYTTPGTYTITLTVTDSTGRQSDPATRTIQVQ